MCPWHLGRAVLSCIWEDDIKPIIKDAFIITVYVCMGIITGTFVVIFTLLLYKFTTLF